MNVKLYKNVWLSNDSHGYYIYEPKKRIDKNGDEINAKNILGNYSHIEHAINSLLDLHLRNYSEAKNLSELKEDLRFIINEIKNIKNLKLE